ncbi:hypothetical protein Glove_21g217 [Diversispora epigaea]|uniref:RING-type domain-containing protein n=1 Tax=Diversispora epigaea TaxID=1348612 RepID=A0A397JUX0_9GLOM|nr:hypothetical protein Glove_21g217 [Diversispora epigaea]
MSSHDNSIYLWHTFSVQSRIKSEGTMNIDSGLFLYIVAVCAEQYGKLRKSVSMSSHDNSIYLWHTFSGAQYRETHDDAIKDKQFVKIKTCEECENENIGLVYESFTILTYGYIYHRKCIEKKFLLTQSNICPTSGCNKSVKPVIIEQRFSQLSQSNTSSIIRRISNQLQLNLPVIREEDALQIEPRNCSKCSEIISPEILEPVILLPCNHVVHFECINNKCKLCPECLSIDDLKKEGYYISPTILVNKTLKKKGKMQEGDIYKNKPKGSQNQKKNI